MKLTLSPCASNKDTKISVSGDIITIDGVPYDLSSIPIDGEVEGENPAIGLIKNIGGEYHITILYFYNSATAKPNQSKDINDYIFDVTNGDVPDPIERLAIEEEE